MNANLNAIVRNAIDAIHQSARETINAGQREEQQGATYLRDVFGQAREQIAAAIADANREVEAEAAASAERIELQVAAGIAGLEGMIEAGLNNLHAVGRERSWDLASRIAAFTAPIPVQPVLAPREEEPAFVPLPVEEINRRLAAREMAELIEQPELTDDQHKRFSTKMEGLVPQLLAAFAPAPIADGPAEEGGIDLAVEHKDEEPAAPVSTPEELTDGIDLRNDAVDVQVVAETAPLVAPRQPAELVSTAANKPVSAACEPKQIKARKPRKPRK